MRMKQINLDDDGMPERFTAELTVSEGAFLALLLGQQTGDSSNEVMAGGSDLCAAVHESLTGDLFNRFYDNGVEDAR